MEYKRFGNTIVLRMEKGEEIISGLKQLCISEGIRLGSVSGIGAVNKAVVGIFHTASKTYYSKEYTGDYEIASLTGNLTLMGEEPYLHLHIVLGNVETNETYAGHLSSATISATGEIIVTIIDGKVNRGFSDEIGLNLMEF
ncbi:MAG: DNA-binding protein [Clostridiales bacterium]|jgi:predicted DNA-binding protein with PD1-like motif|nr:DNA-binding protein [Clostridiales bacterium]